MEDGPMPPAGRRCARAVIEYDGTDFAGSQYQPHVRTVQGELEEALNRLTGERTRVRFAGRTDAGVHATGQVVAFCLARRRRGEGIGWPELRRRLNATLPPDLALRSLRPASAGFDPRRDARSRVYRYRISKTSIVGPDDVYVLDPTDQPTLTLVTCYPFEFVGHAPRRFIVQATLTGQEAQAGVAGKDGGAGR